MSLVAVYGSLKKGLHNHGLLSSGEFIGSHLTEPKFSMFSLGSFPGVVAGDSSIFVEVYEADEYTMERLDMLEGVPDFYDREYIMTPWGEAIIYIYQDDPSPHTVESGFWRG